MTLLSTFVLEAGRPWGEVAASFQVEDAEAIFGDGGPPWFFLTRPRGGSKTTDLAGVSLACLAAAAAPGARGYVVAVNRDQAALLVDAAAGLVDRTSALHEVVRVDNYKLTARSGASVEVRAADGGGLFGLRPSLLVLDEFAQWGEGTAARRVWEALLSSASKVPGARMVILTSAGEPGHWSHRVREEALRSPDRWRVHEVPGPVPWADLAGLEAQRALLTDSQYARLHLNRWTASEDRLVSAEDLEAAAVLEGPLDPVAGVRYVVTADLGLVNDRTMVVVVHAEEVGAEFGGPRRVVVDRLARWRGSKGRPVQLAEVEAFIEQASRIYNRTEAFIGPWQAQGLIQRLGSRGVRAQEFVFSQQSAGRVGQALHLALRNRLIQLPNDQVLLDELGRGPATRDEPGCGAVGSRFGRP